MQDPCLKKPLVVPLVIRTNDFKTTWLKHIWLEEPPPKETLVVKAPGYEKPWMQNPGCETPGCNNP